MERVALIEELLAPMRKALERAYDQGVANTTADFAEKRRIVLELTLERRAVERRGLGIAAAADIFLGQRAPRVHRAYHFDVP